MTDELALEGIARDLVRHLQNVRKELGLDVSDRIARALRRRRARRARCSTRTATGSPARCSPTRFEPDGGGDHRFAAGGAEIAFAVERA